MNYKEYKRKEKINQLFDKADVKVNIEFEKLSNKIKDKINKLRLVEMEHNDDIYYISEKEVLFSINNKYNSITLNIEYNDNEMNEHINYFILNEIVDVSEYIIDTSDVLGTLYELLQP